MFSHRLYLKIILIIGLILLAGAAFQVQYLVNVVMALGLLGYSSLSHVEQLEERHPGFRPVIAHNNYPRTSDIRIDTERGHRQLAAVRSHMSLQGQEVALLSLQDIREQLDEKESESWIRLTHVLTHEIMNSIAPIISLSETLTSYFEHDGVAKTKEELTDQVIGKTVKGLAIVRRRGKNLLHFAESYRKLTYVPTPVVIAFIFSEFTDNLRNLLQPELEAGGVALDIGISPPGLMVEADEELLSQVMINLIKNAIQALEHRPDAHIRLTATRAECLVTEVADNGPGIGLSLSRQIIRLHGGKLTVRSTPGTETCFTISIPLYG